MKKKYTIQQGLSLVEILIVVAIIGILASLMLISYNSTRQKARDSQRANDLSSVRLAIETWAQFNNGKYPHNGSATGGCATLADRSQNYLALGDSTVHNDNITVLIPGYLQELPQDPLFAQNNEQTYEYCACELNGFTPAQTAEDAYHYELNLTFEGNPDNLMGGDGGNDPTRYEIGTSLECLSPIP
jgi:prepilin-type N-terminal cleavage/methylation domain-containing protein